MHYFWVFSTLPGSPAHLANKANENSWFLPGFIGLVSLTP
jgi:hypothetical protein